MSLLDMLHIELNALAYSTAMISEYLELSRVCANQNIPVTVSYEFNANMRVAIENLRVISTRLELPVTGHLATKAQEAFDTVCKGSVPLNGSEMTLCRAALQDLRSSVYKELAERRAIVVGQSKLDLFLQPNPVFGESVSLKFAKAATDIAEAGKCLALGRATACVFHLMRIAEYAVQRLGKKLKVQIDVERESWYDILTHVNKAVNALPAQTQAQARFKQRYGAAAAHLNAVRIATRNDVMHPKATYTDEEAQALFDATKALMQHMAKIV